MGCVCSTSPPPPPVSCYGVSKPVPWTHPEPITREELDKMQEKFWAQPPKRCKREIWLALQMACQVLIFATEPESFMAQKILDNAGIRRKLSDDLSVCYDKRGVRYELPDYVQGFPTNLIEIW